MKTQAAIAFDLPTMTDGREYEDALIFGSAATSQVNVEAVNQPISGRWYQPTAGAQPVTVLYLHGGGYAYYSKSHHTLIALVTLATQARTFAPDYRLIPEHPYPAQLDDALAAYQWLIDSGVDPTRLVVMGDSAGGNLTLALLQALRAARSALPALAVCLAPWTDLTNSGASMTTNLDHDWLAPRMAERWAQWFCRHITPDDPLVSPVYADLSGLPPIYIQVGSAEILYDMNRALADRAQHQGAAVTLDVWPNMTHDFQAFGDLIPESKDALRRIGEVVRQHVTPL